MKRSWDGGMAFWVPADDQYWPLLMVAVVIVVLLDQGRQANYMIT